MAKQGRGILGNPQGRFGSKIFSCNKGKGIVRGYKYNAKAVADINKGKHGQLIKELGVLAKQMPDSIWEPIQPFIGDRGGIIRSALKQNKGKYPAINTKGGRGYYITNIVGGIVRGMSVRGIWNNQFTGTNFGNSTGIVSTQYTIIHNYIVHIETRKVAMKLAQAVPTGELFSRALPMLGYPTGRYIGMTYISSTDYTYISKPLLFSAYNPGE